MSHDRSVSQYLDRIRSEPFLSHQVAAHFSLGARPGHMVELEEGVGQEAAGILRRLGIQQLFSHQREAMALIRNRRHVVVATPTASGKSLVYLAPFVEMVIEDPASRALYLTPLKALAQDQQSAFRRLAGQVTGMQLTSEIYDGDTTQWHRRRIRQAPPHMLMSNPDMLHLSLLPYHDQWATFFADLKMVVVDEVHTYRGVMGSHMALVFRRLIRICRAYGASPVFVFCSATVSNPGALTEQLTGLTVHPVTTSGSPRGKRHILLLNPDHGMVAMVIDLLRSALDHGLRTIVYTQSRRLTELLSIWSARQDPAISERISAYRAGLLPEERRDVEQRLESGRLLAVISTSALELGIDIGDLDVCILAGYPGSAVSTWQRTGRVGRSGQTSLMMLVAGEDALDQYFMRNPEVFLRRPPESAVVNPYNPSILASHLECAAVEKPLQNDEPMMTDSRVAAVAGRLEKEAVLLRSHDGSRLFSKRKMPHRDVDLRGAGRRYGIFHADTGDRIGDLDESRAFRETHPGAIYLHRGRRYQVGHLDRDARRVIVSPTDASYYTKVRTSKETEILECDAHHYIRDMRICHGRLQVTERVTGYETWQLHGTRKLNVFPLDLPPLVYETDGFWYELPWRVEQATQDRHLHFMGGIHAVEHAAIGVLPLLVLADRNDLGGLSTTYHHQTGVPTVFIFEGAHGGAGLSREAFRQGRQVLRNAQHAIESCPCDTGCPACVHSPKCGSGNRPMDKTAAAFILRSLGLGKDALNRQSHTTEAGSPPRDKKEESPTPVVTGQTDAPMRKHAGAKATRRRCRHGKRRRSSATVSAGVDADGLVAVDVSPAPGATAHPAFEGRVGVFDIETQRSAAEVGGWHRADLMRVSCIVLYDDKSGTYEVFDEAGVPRFIDRLESFDRIVGFNVKRFDYRVLSGYSGDDFRQLPTLDILEEVHRYLGFRLSLDHLARKTLGIRKSADGLQALKWWKEGNLKAIADYCRQDVKITRDLYRFGRDNGYLVFENKAGHEVRVPVDW